MHTGAHRCAGILKRYRANARARARARAERRIAMVAIARERVPLWIYTRLSFYVRIPLLSLKSRCFSRTRSFLSLFSLKMNGISRREEITHAPLIVPGGPTSGRILLATFLPVSPISPLVLPLVPDSTTIRSRGCCRVPFPSSSSPSSSLFLMHLSSLTGAPSRGTSHFSLSHVVRDASTARPRRFL